MLDKIKTLYKKYEEMINYLVFGVLTTVINLITYKLLMITILSSKTPLDIQIATVISWVVAVTFAYFTNKYFVFKSYVKGKSQLKEITSFFLARLSSLFIEMIFMYVTVSMLSMNDDIAKLAAQIIVIIFNYVLSKLVIFKK